MAYGNTSIRPDVHFQYMAIPVHACTDSYPIQAELLPFANEMCQKNKENKEQ